MMKVTTKQTMTISSVFWLLLIFTAGHIISLHSNWNIVVSAQPIVNCTNSDRLVVSVRGNRRPCSFFALRQSFCDNIDKNTGQVVGKICAKECPRISGCTPPTNPLPAPVPVPVSVPKPVLVTVPVPVQVTVPVPVSAPKPVLVTAPVPVQVTVPVPVPVTAPVPVTIPAGGIPPGPYISVSKSSEMVTIPRPPLTFVDDGITNSTNCPHKDTTLKLWHDVSTWGTRLPMSGENVVIPNNARILIDRTILESLGIVTIPLASELILGSSSSGISVTARGFQVYGKLIAGSETCHISTPINITLTGKRPDDVVTNIPPPEIKGISVNGGLLSLHGKRYTQTWSRLAKTVTVGSKVIMLQEYVNWSPGQQIVLVTSSLKDSRDYNRNEILTIDAVNNNPPAGVGSIVYVKESVKYDHVATSGYQVEVGLLSRTITIQGDDQSEPTDKDPGNCKDPDFDVKPSIHYQTTAPCMKFERTGYGGHIMIHNNGIGQVEGVQLYRMGQTNVLGRYPMHFHLLNNACPSCYFNANSIHHSFYRCISIHGTHNTTVSENVAYDVTGYCYYLESGIEEDNMISYNLAAHIHALGDDIVRFQGPNGPKFTASSSLIIPADVTSSGYYISNLHNNIIGNAASGGWAGFHFPGLPTPIGDTTVRSLPFRPMNVESLKIDGNTAHSTGWWWLNAAPFYFGGALVYDGSGKLEYFVARTLDYRRDTCSVNACLLEPYKNCGRCLPTYRTLPRISNSKAFLTAGSGFSAWNARIEVIGYEAYDFRLAFQAFAKGVWVDNMLAVCRSGTPLDVPSKNVNNLQANGVIWYDTNQKHIITDSKFRNCGYRTDPATTLGCRNDDPTTGCRSDSRTFGYLSDSNQFSPELMHGTRNITFDNCDTKVAFETNSNAVSGRNANWLDVDGTISGFNEPTLIGSGVESAKNWWGADENAVTQGPLRFIKKNDGPQRNLGFFRVKWDPALQSKVGSSICTDYDVSCPYEGFVRHRGKMFSPYANPSTVNPGLPLTARADVVGPTGGYGWIIDWNKTAPRTVEFNNVEIEPSTVMLISIPYPKDTKFEVTATAEECQTSSAFSCTTQFTMVSTIDEVSKGKGDNYHVDSNGVLTFRLAQIAQYNTGLPTWSLPDYSTPSRKPLTDPVSLSRFERDGVRLPVFHSGNFYRIRAICPGENASSSPTTGYCSQPVPIYDPDVCDNGYVQTAYDKCCLKTDKTKCIWSNGSRNH